MTFYNSDNIFPNDINYNEYNNQEDNQNENYSYFIREQVNIPTYEPEIPVVKNENENENENEYPKDDIYEENDNFVSEIKKENNIENKLVSDYRTKISNENTKMTTKTLGKKTKRTTNEEEKTNNYKAKTSLQGRKKKEEKDKGNHTKFSEDNMMRKIKSYFLNFCHNLLNESISDKNLQFLKLNSLINENLKKEFNLNLLNTKIKDLYQFSKISSKYRKQAKEFADKNKYIIEKINEDNVEIQTIKILDLTYKELFNIFRRQILDINLDLKMKIKDITLLDNQKYKNINLFFDEIFRQEINKNETKENIDIYINNIKDLCMNYESWFLSKKGRNRTIKCKDN
jgi:hypothetical protein